eukprot:gnl/TRDRNA2_/TRDRNA2_82347_c0_seq1.p1 gnl/TRDRNA2_/TRDRNA2_82347_c0~~gnl/TRDRNA2_/TRDRNA2_82347_c0_seq1.p1  ORF type:complete len:265 (-),score=24.32 gnl/TRDRNA2_/TRDRNA2_82347_c0_seq1:60-854(-)
MRSSLLGDVAQAPARSKSRSRAFLLASVAGLLGYSAWLSLSCTSTQSTEAVSAATHELSLARSTKQATNWTEDAHHSFKWMVEASSVRHRRHAVVDNTTLGMSGRIDSRPLTMPKVFMPLRAFRPGTTSSDASYPRTRTAQTTLRAMRGVAERAKSQTRDDAKRSSIVKKLYWHETVSTRAKCCSVCRGSQKKYYSVDRIMGFCGECCMDPKDFWLFKVFEPGLEGPVDNRVDPCSNHDFPRYSETVIHGVGPLSIRLDLFAPA